MAVLHLIEFLLVIAAVWLVFVRIRPDRKCPRCEGRPISCARCDNSGRVFRLGARWAHRADLALRRAIAEWRSR